MHTTQLLFAKNLIVLQLLGIDSDKCQNNRITMNVKDIIIFYSAVKMTAE